MLGLLDQSISAGPFAALGLIVLSGVCSLYRTARVWCLYTISSAGVQHFWVLARPSFLQFFWKHRSAKSLSTFFDIRKIYRCMHQRGTREGGCQGVILSFPAISFADEGRTAYGRPRRRDGLPFYCAKLARWTVFCAVFSMCVQPYAPCEEERRKIMFSRGFTWRPSAVIRGILPRRKQVRI